MSATPKFGNFTFVGLQTGKTYNVDLYISDVAAAKVRFDDGAGAGAATKEYWQPPEDVALVDYAQVTGTADTEKFRVTVNGRPTMHVLRYDVHTSTVATRPPLNIKFKANAQISGIQIAD